MSIAENIKRIKNEIGDATLIAVSKTKPNEDILEAFEAGQIDFGENKAQEMQRKAEELPSEIRWHFIGHLQRNKVKYIAPHAHLIHSVDSLRLLQEINKRAAGLDRTIDVLLQMYIASEESKFGLNESELIELLEGEEFKSMDNIRVVGLMGMATNSSNQELVRSEFDQLKTIFDSHREKYGFHTLSMGMSNDYKIALESGSTMLRIGSSIFGARNY